MAVLAAVASAQAQAMKLLVVPLELASVPKIAEFEPTEVELQIYAATWKALGKTFAAKGHVWASPESVAKAFERSTFDPGNSKDRELDSLLALTHSLGCDGLIVVVVEKLEQKNRGSRDILSNAGKAASDTKVRVRVWAADARDGTLRSVGKDVIEGVAEGQFFGTTDRSDLGGSPSDKTVMIQLEGKRRTDAYGRAIADAVKKALGGWLSAPLRPASNG